MQNIKEIKSLASGIADDNLKITGLLCKISMRCDVSRDIMREIDNLKDVIKMKSDQINHECRRAEASIKSNQYKLNSYKRREAELERNLLRSNKANDNLIKEFNAKKSTPEQNVFEVKDQATFESLMSQMEKSFEDEDKIEDPVGNEPAKKLTSHPK